MGDIQRQAQMAGLFDGSLSSCETELQELMRQIDIMVNNKRQKWEATIQSTEGQLKQREQEIAKMKMALDLKTAEGNRLTHELAGMERTQKELVSQYEQQVDQLRKEMTSLQKSYEKLQRHHGKQSDGIEKAREEAEGKLRNTRVELRMAEGKMEEFETKAREWDIQKRAYKQQVEGLESQRQTLAERCHAVQQENTGYKHQLGKRQQLLDQSDLDFRTRIAHIEGQLQRAQDTLDGKNSTIQRLEELLEDAGRGKKVAEDENRQLLEDVGRKEHQIHVLETEVTSLQQELDAKEGALHVAKMECSEHLATFESALAAKDNVLRNLEDEQRMQSMQVSEETSRLRNQLQDSQRRIGDLVESEASLKMEISRLQNRLDAVQGDNAELNIELTNKIEELRRLENETRKYQSSEPQKSQLEVHIERRLQAELAGMRKEIESLTVALQQRNATVDVLSNQASNMERRMREAVDLKEKDGSELQVANAQLEALRVENRSLRESKLLQIPAVTSVTDGRVVDMVGGQPREVGFVHGQQKPSTTQNREVNVHVLQDQLQSVQRQLQLAKVMESTGPGPAGRPGLDSSPGRTRPNFRMRPSTTHYRTRPDIDTGRPGPDTSPARLWPVASAGMTRSSNSSPVKIRPDPRTQYNSSTHYATQNIQLRRIPDGMSELPEKLTEMESDDGVSSLETGSIKSGCSDLLPSPPVMSMLSDDVSGDDVEVSSLNITGLSELGLPSELTRHNRPLSRESVGTRFLKEDQKHQAELEKILNAHIHELEQKTSETLAKHANRLGQSNGEMRC